MIYSLRPQPKVNKSHISTKCLKVTGLVFTWARFQNCGIINNINGKHVFLHCFEVEGSDDEAEIEKANVQARVPELNSHVFNLGKR